MLTNDTSTSEIIETALGPQEESKAARGRAITVGRILLVWPDGGRAIRIASPK